MKPFSARSVSAYLACALILGTTAAIAEPLRRNDHRHALVHSHGVINKVVVTRPASIRTVAPVSALSLNRLSPGHLRFLHDGEVFYYSEGVYYRQNPQGLVIVKPQTGFRVAALPRGYKIVRNGSTVLYSYNNVRYKKIDGFFVVV